MRLETWKGGAALVVMPLVVGCIHARPRPDDRPRRDGVLAVEANVQAPAGAKSVVVWMPIPRDEASQVLRGVRTVLPDGATSRTVEDEVHGNSAVRVELPAGTTASVKVEFTVTRGEERRGARLPASPAETAYDGRSWKSD
ncbi:MAG TPA: hypothetical protein VMV18_15030, partial [bacterium]|nr:hypothetical protein [bacterium]